MILFVTNKQQCAYVLQSPVNRCDFNHSRLHFAYGSLILVLIFLSFYSLICFAGATESVGKHMLEACNNNLEMAVTMFLDGDGITQEPSTSSSSAASSSRAPPSEYFILLHLICCFDFLFTKGHFYSCWLLKIYVVLFQ